MHIDTEIEEVEEDPMETSDDESTEDKTYKMSSVPPSENGNEDDDESNDSGVRQEVENDEEEGWLRGLSILDLIEGILSTLDLPSESRTNLCTIMSQATKAKGKQSK
jgi:hypothetical protein